MLRPPWLGGWSTVSSPPPNWISKSAGSPTSFCPAALPQSARASRHFMARSISLSDWPTTSLARRWPAICFCRMPQKEWTHFSKSGLRAGEGNDKRALERPSALLNQGWFSLIQLAKLFRRNQRVRDRVNGKRDAVLNADFPHQLGHVRFDGALFDAERSADLFVGAASHQHFQNFLLAIGEGYAAGREDAARGGTNALDKQGQHAPGSPNRSLVHNPNGLNEFGRGGGFVNVSLGARSDRFQNGFFIHTCAGNDNAQVGAGGFQAGHHVEQVLAAAVAEQNQVDVLHHSDVGQGGRNQFEVRFRVEQSAESDETQRITFYHGDADEFFCRCSFCSGCRFHHRPVSCSKDMLRISVLRAYARFRNVGRITGVTLGPDVT